MGELQGIPLTPQAETVAALIRDFEWESWGLEILRRSKLTPAGALARFSRDDHPL